jgi:hypothetical protein
MPRSSRAGRTPPAPSRTTTRGGTPPNPPDDGDSSLDDGECCPFSPMIVSVDKEEDRSCGARSWSLHTDCWSLSAKEGGADSDNCRRVDDDKNYVRTRGKDSANAAAPPARTRTKTACHRHGTGFCRSDLRNKERAGGIHPPPFTGPNNNDRQRSRAGGGQRSSRTGAVGRQWRLAVVRASGGGRNEQLKREGGV